MKKGHVSRVVVVLALTIGVATAWIANGRAVALNSSMANSTLQVAEALTFDGGTSVPRPSARDGG
jgi:hypothetical protein